MRRTTTDQWPDERALGAVLVIIFFFMISLFTYWTPTPEQLGVTPTPSPSPTAEPTMQPSPSPSATPAPQDWQAMAVEDYALTLAYAASWGQPTSQVISYKAGSSDSVFDHLELTFATGPTIRLSKLASYQERDRRTEQLDASVASLKLDFVQKKVAEPTPVFLPPVQVLGKTVAPQYIENSTSTLRGVYYFTEPANGNGNLTTVVANLMTSDETVVQIVYTTTDVADAKVVCADATECMMPSSLLTWVTDHLKPAISQIK